MIEKRGKKEYPKKRRLQCSFENHGKECLLTGDISPHVGDGARFYCSFHHHILSAGSNLNTFQHFLDWLTEYKEQWRENLYGQSQFHKYDASKLWELMGNM